VEALLVLGAVLGVSLLPFLPDPSWSWAFAACLAVMVVVAHRAGRPKAEFLCVTGMLLAGLCGVPGLWPTWPVPLLLALAIAALIARFHPGIRPALAFWRRGDPQRSDLPWTATFVVVPGLALVGWVGITSPDLTDLFGRLPDVPLPLLILGGLLFSMANALAEEVFWRGVMVQALEPVFRRPLAVYLVQAVSFGLVHIHGFPSGWSGVLLATVYGAMMGELRRRTRGLLLPWFAHIFADAVIFGVLATLR